MCHSQVAGKGGIERTMLMPITKDSSGNSLSIRRTKNCLRKKAVSDRVWIRLFASNRMPVIKYPLRTKNN